MFSSTECPLIPFSLTSTGSVKVYLIYDGAVFGAMLYTLDQAALGEGVVVEEMEIQVDSRIPLAIQTMNEFIHILEHLPVKNDEETIEKWKASFRKRVTRPSNELAELHQCHWQHIPQLGVDQATKEAFALDHISHIFNTATHALFTRIKQSGNEKA